MPEPRSGESKNEYITRCVSHLVSKEGKDQKQAVAICYSMWERKNEMGLLNKINLYLNEAKVGEEILKQIKAMDKWALASWGAKNFVTLREDGIQFDVRGSKFKGRVLIYYDKGKDLYNIELGKITKKLEWKQVNFIRNVFAGDLVNILDQHIG
jgi:hypothetical protein